MKNCPWCGREPDIEILPLWNGSHGYHDCYGVAVICKNPECSVNPKTMEYNTIYGCTISAATIQAIEDWDCRE